MIYVQKINEMIYSYKTLIKKEKQKNKKIKYKTIK